MLFKQGKEAEIACTCTWSSPGHGTAIFLPQPSVQTAITKQASRSSYFFLQFEHDIKKG